MKEKISLWIVLAVVPVISLSLTNTDSLKLVLHHTVADSVALENNMQLFTDLNPEDHEAKMVLAEWLVNTCASSQNYEGLAHTYLLIGHYMMERQLHSEAVSYFTNGLRIAEQIKSDYLMGRLYNGLGIVSYEFRNLDQAIFNTKKAIEYTLKSEDKIMLGAYYHNLAGMYFENSSANEDTAAMAIQLCLSALELQMQEHDTLRAINTKMGLAFMYNNTNQQDAAIRQLDEASELIELIHAEYPLISLCLRYGETYLIKKEYEKVIEYLDKGMPYVKKFAAIKWEYNYVRFYALAYAGLGQYKKSTEFNEKYITIRDSIITQENYAMANEIQERYESEKKEKEILQLNKDKEISQIRIQQEEKTQFILEVIIASAVLVLLILSTLTIFLVRLNRSINRMNTELTTKNQEINEQSAKLSEQARLIGKYQSQMNPHFIFNALNNIQGMIITEKKTATLDQLQKLSVLMRLTLRNSDRELILLDEEIDYLKRYLEFEQEKYPRPIAFTVHLPENFNQVLIPPMLIQPFMENALKHAELHTVPNPEITLTLTVMPDILRVVITDNGIGFDSRKMHSDNEAHAISISSSRIEIFWKASGNQRPEKVITIYSKPFLERGTMVEILLPLSYRF